MVGILDTLNGIYDNYVERRRSREDDEKDRKIRELEEKIRKLEEKCKEEVV